MKRIDYLFIALHSIARNYYLYGDVYSIQLTRVWSVCMCTAFRRGQFHATHVILKSNNLKGIIYHGKQVFPGNFSSKMSVSERSF